MKYIYHHLGLGDHIICNGIVMHYLEQYGEVTIFSKKHNYENVSYMFRDVENLHIIPVENDDEVKNFIEEKKIEAEVIKVGHEKLRWGVPGETFDQQFYETSGVPFSVRFEKFHFTRDLEAEEKVYLEKNPNNEPYIFIHDDPERGFTIDKIRQDLKIIRNDNSINLFHLLKLIENAEEVHFMESSLKCIINSYKMEKPRFFYHLYMRDRGAYLNSRGLNNYETVQ
jgi:hypothetical protein